VGFLIFLMIAFCALVVLPVLLVKVVFGLLVLPFKLLGLVFRVVFGVLGGLFRVGFGLVALAGSLLAVALCVVLLPLLPFLLVGGFVWLVVQLARPRPTALRVIG
jgi:hypothetical protein